MPPVDAMTLDGTRQVADVCIIGGGPSGAVVAHMLASSGVDALVLESGSDSFDTHRLGNTPRSLAGHVRGAQADTRGRNVGHPYFPLRMSRVRGIGGSTRALKSHGLRSRPLDPVDFNPRLGTAWPIDFDEFARYIPAAAAYCAIPWDRNQAWDTRALPFDTPGARALRLADFRFGERDAFRRLGRMSADDPRQRWITSATATGFDVDRAGYITTVRVASGSGASFTVEAPITVLAAGGIDTPRMLLANDSVLEHMGRAADHVGRHFMEHLHYVAGHVTPASDEARHELADTFDGSNGVEPWLTVEDSTVVDERLARSVFTPVPAYERSLDPGVNAFGRLLRSVPYGPFDRDLIGEEIRSSARSATKIPGALLQQLNPRSERDVFAITAMSEQVPNAESRITLSDRRDRHGIPLPVLDWQLSELDTRSARRSAELLGSGLEDADLGTFTPTWGATGGRLPVFTGGWHHIGTTRMSADTTTGVTDPDCRVHGVPNLFIAGSSVFPTGGFANPTLSLVALAIRLARHIDGMPRSGAVTDGI